MDNIKNFGPNLRSLINKRGYKTYKLAADAFDISLSYLNQLMRNEREPSMELLGVIAEELGVSPGELLGRDPVEKSLDGHSDRASIILEIQDLIRNMDLEDLETLKFTAENLQKLRDSSVTKNRA